MPYIYKKSTIAWPFPMQLSTEIKSSLKREYSLCSSAVTFYKKALSSFEHKYGISTSLFLKKFEAGSLGDDADFFDWYAYSKLLAQWQKTRSAIRLTCGDTKVR